MSDLNQNHLLYEKFSSLYEFVFKPFFVGGVKKTVSSLQNYEHSKILEVGSGTGYSFQYYPEGVDLTAVDLSDKMVSVSKKRALKSKNKKIKVFNVTEQDKITEEGLFDAVVSFSVITVVPDPQVFLNELKSYCRPGGHVFLIMHTRGEGFWGLIDCILEGPTKLLFGFTLLRRISEYNLDGFRVIEKRPLSRFFFYTYNHLVVLKFVG